MTGRPLLGVAVYNPDLLGKEELLACFVARQGLLNRLLDDLRRIARGGTAQPQLLVGQRGMGKTLLLRRLRYAIEDEPELAAAFLPLTFPEEQYNVGQLSDFYLNCLDALGDQLEHQGQPAEAQQLDRQVNALRLLAEKDRAQRAFETLRDTAARLGRRWVLLVDNIGLILERLKAPEEHWQLREMLSAKDGPVLFGASAVLLESGHKYDAPFYDFFRINELKGLNLEESLDVLRKLSQLLETPQVAEVLKQPGRIRALQTLTGGNPRTLVLLHEVLLRGVNGEVRSDLERLLDRCTPLYKARFEELPIQAQRIMDALALHWDPIAGSELAESMGLDRNVVASQLNRLVQQGSVEKVQYEPESKTGFQVAERFFNIWYLMRNTRRARSRLVWLVEFLKLFYDAAELSNVARRQLSEAPGPSNRRHHVEFGLALSETLAESELKRALESRCAQELVANPELRQRMHEILELDGSDAALKPVVDRYETVREIREVIRAAKVDHAEWNAEEFADLLLGSASLPLQQKAEVAGRIAQLSAEQLVALKRWLNEERRRWNQHWGTEVAGAVLRALRDGHLVDITDAEQLRAAALQTNDSRIEAVAWVARAGELEADGAESAYRKAIEVHHEWASPWNGLGRLLKNHLGRYEEAEAAYRRAIDVDPKYVGAWRSLGDLLRDHLGRYEEAEAAYRRAIDVDPKYIGAWRSLGDLLRDHLGRYEEAEAAYRQAIEVDPTDVHVRTALGLLLQVHLGRYEEAEVAYRQAVEVDPKYVHAWKGLGDLLQVQLGRYEEAEAAYRQAINVDLKDAYAWNNLGNLLRDHLGRYEEAEAAYHQALEVDPKYVYAWNNLGNLLRDHLGRYEEAEAAYRQALEVDPKYVHAWTGLGLLLHGHLGRYEEAEAVYRQALEVDPKGAHVWTGLGLLLQVHLGRYEEAEAAYRQALEVDPKDVYAWLGLGDLFRDHLGRYEEAEAAYRQALEVDPKDVYAWTGLGDLLHGQLGRYEEAELAYRKVVGLTPDRAQDWNSLAWLLYSQAKSPEETEHTARRAHALDSTNPYVLHTLATILVWRGKWDEAREHAHRFMTEGTPEFHAQIWNDTVAFFREAVRAGRARDAIALLDATGFGERWRPLREALVVLESGRPELLRRVAPEVRAPAEQLLAQLSVGKDQARVGSHSSALATAHSYEV